ncbi:hypothetical protein F400_gp061 [Bacillus phage BCD7]|uniref:Uncharacterized protein n=1 Tax=Bacillus phage BCD7 TaxID=1136534 RepID=J9PTY6_9CAUD|nr:hypothetical protein F400_gp061 [Bacillus phage BCD7]AEZ50508.1 hypothetical protein BCD7_0061 [Bacillus phage BCD7]
MMGGNISNRCAPYIGFDIDSLMFEAEESTFRGNLMKFFLNEEQLLFKRKIKSEFIKTLNAVWKQDVSIVLVTRQYTDIESLENFLNAEFIPYTRIVVVRSTDYIGDFPYHYFFTADDTLISIASSKHFMHIDDIWRVLK